MDLLRAVSLTMYVKVVIWGWMCKGKYLPNPPYNYWYKEILISLTIIIRNVCLLSHIIIILLRPRVPSLRIIWSPVTFGRRSSSSALPRRMLTRRMTVESGASCQAERTCFYLRAVVLSFRVIACVSVLPIKVSVLQRTVLLFTSARACTRVPIVVSRVSI